jgi:hypothetical protein
MKKRKLRFTLLATLAMTLAMVTSGFAANGGIQGRDNGSLLVANGQTFQMLMATTNKGATIPTDIIAGSTNLFGLQISPAAINVAAKGTTQGNTTQAIVASNPAQQKMNRNGNADITANSSGGNSSPVKNVFTSAIVETNTADEIMVAKGSRGNFFHAGKILASNSVEVAGMMTSIAT